MAAPTLNTGQRLLLVDGHGYAYRAFYAIRGLKGRDGKPTNAIYGFIKMFIKLMDFVKPTHVAVIWDGGLSTERTSLQPEYKSQRPPMPEELETQLGDIHDFLCASGHRSLLADGVEADDWIAAAAHRAAGVEWEVVIASADKDFMQLVSGRVGLVNPNDKIPRIWGAEEVRQKTGVRPDQVAEWLALIGDAVDNIPGVPGIGPKTASDLLCRYNDLHGIFANLDGLASKRIRDRLIQSKHAVFRNLLMVTLPETMDLDCEVQTWVSGAERDDSKLELLFDRWGFRSLSEELQKKKAGRQQEMF